MLALILSHLLHLGASFPQGPPVGSVCTSDPLCNTIATEAGIPIVNIASFLVPAAIGYTQISKMMDQRESGWGSLLEMFAKGLSAVALLQFIRVAVF